MIPRFRVGVDLVRVSDVDASISRFGERYLRRLYTEHELACSDGPAPAAAAGLAARFAAKEAAVKVLRPSNFRPGWRSIEVQRHRDGWCELRLSGEAARLAEDAGLHSFAVSLSHEGDYAAAVVLAWSAGL